MADAQPKKHNRIKSSILTYLDKLVADSMVIVGQHCENAATTAQGYEAYVEGLYKQTGKYPALIGIEYGYNANSDIPFINQYVKNFWARGGLVTISWHADNPWTEGYNCRWNSIENKAVINFRQLLKNAPESEARTNYRNELMKVGEGLRDLKNAGIVVLWRPFHEMNGPWFWWGTNDVDHPSNVKDYQLLWEDMYQTFTNDLGLDNLLWVYSPFCSESWTSSIGAFYPGSHMVDIVGVDIYSKVPEFKDYPEITKFGKPVTITEIGPLKETYGMYNQPEVLNMLRGRAAWFLQWSSWTSAKVAIVDNLFFMEMMNHPSAITLDRLKRF